MSKTQFPLEVGFSYCTYTHTIKLITLELNSTRNNSTIPIDRHINNFQLRMKKSSKKC